MATSKRHSRYADVEPRSSFSSRGPSPDVKCNASKISSMTNMPSNSSRRCNPYSPINAPDQTDNFSCVLAKNQPSTFGTMVKKFMEKQSNSKLRSTRKVGLTVLVDPIAQDLKKAGEKGSGGVFSNLHCKLFNRAGSADRASSKALTEVNNNTRTLGMVLRSERELLNQNKEYEQMITELRLRLEERNHEADKLKDICLKQREEIKALKDAILFPNFINPRIQDMFESQGSELKDARKVIPSLQKQVSSLTGQIQSLAEDLAVVKADKYATKKYFDEPLNSPKTPQSDKESHVLENVSIDHLRIDDINPCLTPCFSKIKIKGYREEVCYSSDCRDGHFQDCSILSPSSISDSYGGMLSVSSEHCDI